MAGSLSKSNAFSMFLYVSKVIFLFSSLENLSLVLSVIIRLPSTVVCTNLRKAIF